MLFHTAEFLVFATLVFGVWFIVRDRQRARWAFLAMASIFFYGWWDWRYVPLLLANGAVDFWSALVICNNPRHKRMALLISLGFNLGTLAFFKYLGFLTENLNTLLPAEYEVPVMNLVLPVGISFYTFHSMSYTIDAYRGELKPTHDILHYFAYLSLFPHLVAGPIVRAQSILPQLEHPQTTASDIWVGFRWICFGMFKKTVVADNLAPIVDVAFGAQSSSHPGWFAWVGTIAFATQIYCDFSGYTDIARGLGKWLGVDFPHNFEHPYAAKSLREFWQRWHISLSTWFRDYVYIPLGGARRGAIRAHVNLWITMLLSGLWHGANWTYIIWGAFHGVGVSIERGVRRLLGDRVRVPVAAWLLTLTCVLAAWVFFRASSVTQANDMLFGMFTLRDGRTPIDANQLIMVAPLLALIWARQIMFAIHPTGFDLEQRSWFLRCESLIYGALLVGSIYLRGPGQAFIYFQF
jgi:D-alanyl-lipoteichoic acid acyltransferase DltB (MBOAT superfamily)